MNNKKNINKGWLIFLLTILFTSNTFNLEVKALEEVPSTIEQEEIVTSETLTEIELNSNKIEIPNIEEETTNNNNLQNEESSNEVFLEKTKEEIFTTISTNMNFQEKIVIVKGNINQYTSVKELLSNINREELNKYFKETTIGITNEEGTILKESDYLTETSYIIFINDEFISNYKINFLGDLNQDNLVTNEDIDTGIEEFFKEENTSEDITINEDENVVVEIVHEKNITEEISYVDAVIKENTYQVETPNMEEILNIELENTTNEEINPEEEVIIKLNITGFNTNYLNTISGIIKYDNEILELDNIYISVDEQVIGNIKNNKFIYILDNYNYNNDNTIFLITFKSLKSGTTNISIDNLKILMNGIPLNLTTNTNLNIIINEYGKGGDVEIPPFIDNISQSNKPSTNTPTNTIETSKNNTIPLKTNSSTTNNDTTKPLTQLSNDNYLKDIKITNYEIAFDKDINYYQIEVDNNVESLDLNITLNNNKSMYMITGNEQFKPGKNQIILTVQAEDGTTRDYVIEVNKKEKIIYDDKKNNKKDTPQLILIIIMIFVTLILIYKLLRKED